MIPGTLNRLQHEKSPYLLQHAENPVDWYPWGEEAFARAKQEDKPVFLSVGYSTCHWCHVMAHESFEDEEMASLLNEAFVCIKVDREERPDIDGIYMRVCQMMTGSGGWPLTVVMTPERRPFFAATYIPKESRWGKMGLVELIPQIGRLWRTERERIEEAADRDRIRPDAASGSEQGETPGEETLSDAFAELRGQFDAEFGGFGDAPKFPMPHQLLFLLRHGERTGEDEAIRMAEKTLRAMRRGGIFDQLGYGFHRYSTDRQWLVPHFEKMLYDQALCALAVTEAFQAGGDGEHARTAREVLEYVLRDLQAPEGGFYAAEDADSEGEEGRFYLWGMEEIRRLLGPEEARFAAEIFGLEEEGNFTDPVTGKRTGLNILHLADSEEDRRRVWDFRGGAPAAPGDGASPAPGRPRRKDPPPAGRQDPRGLERPDDCGPGPGVLRSGGAPVSRCGPGGRRLRPDADANPGRAAPPPLVRRRAGHDGKSRRLRLHDLGADRILRGGVCRRATCGRRSSFSGF